MAKRYKIVTFVPADAADKIRRLLGELGAGHIGNYDMVSFSVRGIGRFRPLAGAKPALGELGKIEEVEEERIETIVDEDALEYVVKSIEDAHSYEEPVIDVYKLEDID